MNKRILLAIALAALTLSAVAQSLPADSVLRRQVAQMLLVGFRGDSIDDNSDAARYVRDLHVGGVILFDLDMTGSGKLGSRNVTSPGQLAKLTADLQHYAGDTPVLIAIDQEGGLVCRMKTQYGFSPTVNALYLGTTDKKDTTMFYGRRMARELRQSGVNVNLAPLLDVHRDDCPPIGHFKRSFSTDTKVITRHAGWMIDAHHENGVLCAVKHFPGHGNATKDSHYGLVDVTADWRPRELEPFKKLIKQGKVDLVMTAHIYCRALDPDYPATLSHKILTDVLRKQLGYDGVVVTDDMYMEGILNRYPIDEALAMAINAGADLLCAANNINTGFESERPFILVDTIVKLVKEGKIPYSRILESYNRILRLKKKLK